MLSPLGDANRSGGSSDGLLLSQGGNVKALFEAARIKENVHVLKTPERTLCGKSVKLGQIMLCRQPLERINCPDCVERISGDMKLKLLQVREAMPGVEVKSPESVLEMMAEEAKVDRECFWVLHFNVRNKLIEKELVFIGCLDSAVVHPREVFKKAILNGAASIITVHNHPSGETDPSNSDILLWKRLTDSGELLCIEVLDHLVISTRGVYSHKRSGNRV
jgi:DNA repair protein RadC